VFPRKREQPRTSVDPLVLQSVDRCVLFCFSAPL
jgi:hypothetical protein